MSTEQSHPQDGINALKAGNPEAAATAFECALAANAADTETRYLLANVYRDLHRLDDAEREIRRVIDERPAHAKSRSALGVILQESGRPSEAVAAYESALEVDPTYTRAAGNWLNAQQYVSGATDETLSKSLARWREKYAGHAAPQDFANPPTADRPIVVGFVSGDLAAHPVGRLSVKLFENLQPHIVRACVFSTRAPEREDDISRRIARVTRWTSVYGLSDESLLQFIKTAKVDVLIDMEGHTGANRSALFVRRAAPVQAGWLGYPASTGIPAMDYLLTTETLAPPGYEAFAQEKIYRLPTVHLCFDPGEAPPVAPRPAERNGFITFGCFNNPAKIGDDAIASFARIMKRIPGSRLKIWYMVLSTDGARERLYRALESHGIERARVDLGSGVTRADFLSAYNDVDIALDSFPYSGCMTTCEALWMGVPVIAFPGPLMAGRQAAAVLNTVGLTDLIAKDQGDYEDRAVALAEDSRRQTLLRVSLRSTVADSPLCNGRILADDFEEAIQKIWWEWCRSRRT